MIDGLYPVNESSRVLCPELYRILLANFPGGVIVANQGEACMTSSRPIEGGQSYTAINHSGEYYRVNCPFCHDTKHRLWINHMYGQVDANGRQMKFLATCYNDQCLSDYENRKTLNDVLLGFQNYNTQTGPRFAIQPGEWIDPTQLAIVEMPGQVIPMTHLAAASPDHPAVQYLCGDRGYTQQMLANYELCYCPSSSMYPAASNRIIIPIRMNGALVGWQARYIGSADWKSVPKYYGMPGMRKRVMLYNYDRAKNSPFVTIVEGATDVHVVGDTCVALLGKNLSQYQLTLLLNTWQNKPIVLIFDPDAREDMRKTVEELRNSVAVVVEIVLPGEYDCGDYHRDRRTLWNIIYTQAAAMGVRLPQVA